MALVDGLVAAAFDVDVSRDTDTQLRVGGPFVDPILLNFPVPDPPSVPAAINGTCEVMAGSTGGHGETLSVAEWTGLLDELTALVNSGGFTMNIDKTGLAVNGSTSEGHALHLAHDGTFADPSTGHTKIQLGSPHSEVAPTVTWLSSNEDVDMFVFTGQIVVWANGVGRGGKKSNRIIACGGAGANTVTVTVDRSPA